MSKKISALNKRFNSFIFIVACGVFTFFSFLQYTNIEVRLFRDLAAVLLFSVVVFINYSIPQKKCFQDRRVYILMYGIFMWLSFCLFCMVTKAVDVTDSQARYKLFSQIALTLTLFLSARIIIAYDLILLFLRTVILIAGILINIHYIYFFDGFRFLSSITSILLAARYRNPYGFSHPGFAGISCCSFIIISVIYKSFLEERHKIYMRDIIYLYSLMIDVLALVILFSSAARASMTGIVIYFLAYTLLGIYKKNTVTANALLIVVLASIAIFIIVSVDWAFVISQSGRLGNFTVLLNISPKALLIGNGFMTMYAGEGRRLLRSLGGSFVDSLYAVVIMRSGIIGFSLFWGTMFITTFLYFHKNMKRITKLQRAVGSFTLLFIYFSIFEYIFYDYTWFTLTFWVILVTTINGSHKDNKVKYVNAEQVILNKRMVPIKPRRMPVKILHNS